MLAPTTTGGWSAPGRQGAALAYAADGLPVSPLRLKKLLRPGPIYLAPDACPGRWDCACDVNTCHGFYAATTDPSSVVFIPALQLRRVAVSPGPYTTPMDATPGRRGRLLCGRVRTVHGDVAGGDRPVR